MNLALWPAPCAGHAAGGSWNSRAWFTDAGVPELLELIIDTGENRERDPSEVDVTRRLDAWRGRVGLAGSFRSPRGL